MAPSAGPVSSRRSSGEVFDPTAYAARRKEKLQAAATLREQRMKEQEKRESDRGAGTPLAATAFGQHRVRDHRTRLAYWLSAVLLGTLPDG